MSNQSLTDVLNTTAKFIDSSFERPVEAEFLLADYDREVFKIVKTTAQHTITQKYINGTKLVIEGFFKVCVYYQPPMGANLTVISKKLPFQHQIDIQGAVKPPYFINVDGGLEYVNTRAINSSRIDVRGVYSFEVVGYNYAKTDITTAINSTTACSETENLLHFYLCGNGIRQFSIEDELDIPDNVEKIINITHSGNKSTVTSYQNKVNVKGSVEVDVAYMIENDMKLYHATKTLNYNQIVDIEGTKENNTAFADFSVLNYTVTKNPDTKKTTFILSATLDVKVFEKAEIIAVSDVFSKTYEYTKEVQSIVYDENLISIDRNTTVLLEDEIGEGFEHIYDFAEISSPKVIFSDENAELKSKITFSAILKNSQGEYECFSKTGEVTFDTGEEVSEENEYLLTADIIDSSVNIDGGTFTVKINIGLSGVVIKRHRINTVRTFEEKTDRLLSRDGDALILYYGKKGEKLFDIAQRYKTDVESIMEENELTEKVLIENRMLFIPAFGM